MRDYTIDAIKGFLIVCVVCGHFNYMLLSDTGPQQAAIVINEWIYLFHMPLFLAVSFIFIKPLNVKNFTDYAKKILIPYCFWVFIFFQPVNTSGTIPNKFKAMVYGTYAMGTSIFWFLAVLFVCKIIMSYYMRIASSQRWRIVFWCIFGLFACLIYYFYPQLSRPEVVSVTPFNFILCLYIFPMLFFVNNMYLHKVYWRQKIPTLLLFFIVCGLFAYLMLLAQRSPVHRVDLAPFVLPHRIDLIIAMVLLWATVLLLLDRWFSTPNSMVRYVSRLGFYSLVIFIFHIPIKRFLEEYVLKSVPENLIWTRVLVSVALILMTCELCILVSWVGMAVSERLKIIGLTRRAV